MQHTNNPVRPIKEDYIHVAKYINNPIFSWLYFSGCGVMEPSAILFNLPPDEVDNPFIVAVWRVKKYH